MRSFAKRVTTAVVVPCLVGAGLLALAGPAHADTPGSLDTTWNGTGIATTSIGGVDTANAVVVQPDGKTVAVGNGQASFGSVPHFALVRYTATGSLDPSFAGGGIAVTPSFYGESSNGDQANAVAVQPNGKIVVAGSASNSSGLGALAVTRYQSDGTLDGSFGTGGQAKVMVSDGSYNTGQAMTLEPNGDIVVVGSWFGGWAVARFTPAGVLDTTFNPAGSQPGVQAFNLGDSFFDNAYAVTTEKVNGQTDIVVGGSAAHNPNAGAGVGNEDFGLVRLTDSGDFDSTFGTNGVVRTDFGGDSDQVSALVTQSDGTIYAAGQSGNAAGAHSIAIARYLSSGSLDTTFNSTGTEALGPVAPTDAKRGIDVLPDATILVTATVPVNSGDVALVKLLPSGALDNSFGSGGVVTTNVAQDASNALAIDPTNGRVVVVGAARTSASSESFLVARYVATALPWVTDVSPSSGPVAGGNTVTVTGTGFTDATDVVFGGVDATGVSVLDSHTITATAPAHAAGSVHVRVTTPSGLSPVVAGDRYLYLDAPAITSLSPVSGLPAGGNTVTITGTAFTGTTAVNFAAVPATSFTVVSGTKITAVAPAQSAGAVDVRVVTPSGTSAVASADVYTYEDAPTVTSLSPSSGAPAGGNPITIKGTGFIGASAVHFGSADATGVSVVNATTITAVVPAHSADTVNVRVETPSGISAIVPADRYTYRDAPTVTSVSPVSGPLAGGKKITVTGTGFTGATSVLVGGAAASAVTVVNSGKLTAVAPSHAAGAVDVRVVTPSGTSPAVAADRYTYQDAPTVTSVSPSAGAAAGGNSVTITGTGFIGASAVHFGSADATDVTVVNATTINAVVPPHAAGRVNVRVVTPSGTSAIVPAGRYTYS